MTKSEEKRINDSIKKLINKAKRSKRRYIEIYSSMPPKVDNSIISPSSVINYCKSNGLTYCFYDDMNRVLKKNATVKKWDDCHHMVVYW